MANRVLRDASLEKLLCKQAISEVLMRYCRACDRCDWELLETCYHPDAVEEHGIFVGPAHEFAREAIRRASRYSMTFHTLSNVLIDVNGEEAHAESYVLLAARSDVDGDVVDLTVGCRYVDRFERREGEWRIAHRRVVLDWSRRQVGGETWAEADRFIQGRRDGRDPVYRASQARPALPATGGSPSG